MSQSKSIEEIVRQTPDLPTIPAAALAVMRESESATSTANSVAKHIANDQALAARVLRLANSAYYGLAGEVTDLQECVVVLGMRCIRNLSMVAATYPWMIRPLKGYGLEPKQMWTHSFGVAVAAQRVAKETRAADPDLAFTAGLLHNIGKVVLSVCLEKELGKVVRLAEMSKISFDAAEKKVLGFDHCEVGEYLGRMWNLPKPLIAAIRYHHEPNACETPMPIVDCVHVGDVLTLTMGFGLGGDGLQYCYDESVWERLGLESEKVDEIALKFSEDYLAYEKMFEELSPAA